MQEANIVATFGPAPGDRATLSKTSNRTLDAIYQHPLSHNLEWPDVIALFEKLGSVGAKSHNELMFGIAGEHHRVRKSHGKDVATDDVMMFRHMLTKAGWAPSEKPGSKREAHQRQAAAAPHLAPSDVAVSDHSDLLVVVEHHEARLYQLDVGSADQVDHVILPYDPHHVLNHLTHKDESRERGQRAPEDHTFYERIARALASAGRVVLIGHGKGHSNAAHHLAEYLREHHHDIFLKIVSDSVADISSQTAPQLLALGRCALTN